MPAVRLLAVFLVLGGWTVNVAASDTLSIHSASGTHQFNIEFAETPDERSRGLMFRQSLADDAGMLFDFGEPHEVFMWMKNTYIPLDMIFIRPDGVIHRIEAWTEPHSLSTIPSRGPVTGVFEVKGGLTEKLGIMPGDMVEHPMFAGD